MSAYGEARQILELELYEWELCLSVEFTDRHNFSKAYGKSNYDHIIHSIHTVRGLRRALRSLEVPSYCQCDSHLKPGQTSVMCCNICGAPDEAFWKPEKHG